MLGFHQAVTSYKESECGKSFKNFAYLCIWRKIIDAVKKASSIKNAPLNNSVGIADAERMFSYTSPEDSVIFAEDRLELNERMSRVLTDIEFKVFTMYLDGATSMEICEITGKSAKSVYNAVQRSKKKLTCVLQETSER